MVNQKLSDLTNVNTLDDAAEFYITTPTVDGAIAWVALKGLLTATALPTAVDDQFIVRDGGAWVARSLNGAPIQGVAGNGAVYYQGGALRFLSTAPVHRRRASEAGEWIDGSDGRGPRPR